MGISPAVATPSISEGFKPTSSSALRAASAWSCTWDRLGILPNSVVSAAPTMAMELGFILGLRRLEFR